MSKASDYEIENLRRDLKKAISRYFAAFDLFVDRDLSDKEIVELSNYYSRFGRNHSGGIDIDPNMEKAKIFMLLFRKLFNPNDAGKILSFLESIEYGWHDDEYHLYNKCLRLKLHSSRGYCKRKYVISTKEVAIKSFRGICDIFLHREYGKITLFIFCYCLAALFSGKLNQDGFRIPFFLQITCDRKSVLYQLIQEIVEICDVNSGLLDKCNDEFHQYGYCGCGYKTHYPSQSIENDINYLFCDKDIPVIIDGHENQHYYNALLREVANIPNKRNYIGRRDKFNTLPVFISPEIKSSFNNVLDMPLTDLEVSNEYLNLLQINKQILASWVLELVANYATYLFPHMSEIDKKKHFFSSEILNYINYVRQEYPDITLENAKNIGALNFFFKGYLRVLQELCIFQFDTEFSFYTGADGKPVVQNKEKHIALLMELSEISLVELHRNYLPAPRSTGVNNKGVIRLAKQIEKHYKALKVNIRVVPMDVKEDRYIFDVYTLYETKDTDVARIAETVQRRLKKYEYFRVDLSDSTTIKIIVAVKQIEDNDLIKIFEHKDFLSSKMKIPYAIGYDDMGNAYIKDIHEFPHLLLGGTTRSGKSTAMMCLLMSIAYKHRTGNVNVLILDLLGKKELYFEIFNNQPIMSYPVIKDTKTALKAILYLKDVMDSRLKDTNLSHMPHIVCVIDEFPRLFSSIENKDESRRLETAITNLLSAGRHAKIHLVLAAQDPTKKHMVCGIGNLPAKMAFRCTHYSRSVAILGRAGADKLLGKGRMIFDSNDEQDKRLQGAYIPENDAIELLKEITKTFKQENKYKFAIDEAELAELSMESVEESSEKTETTYKKVTFDEKLADIIMLLLDQGKVSNDTVQKQAGVAYHEASEYMDKLVEYGLIPPLEEKRSARKINPIEEINLTEVITTLTKGKDYLIEKGYSETDIAMVLKKLSNETTPNDAT
jgi:hypothetical protein